MIKEFKTFITRGNVVDLAVGIVVGAAFTAIVNALVDGLINPLVALTGDNDLSGLTFAIGTRVVGGEVVPNAFAYGALLDAILNFVLVAAAVFFMVVKPINTLQARRASGEPTPEPTTRNCPECLSDIPKKASRCRFCTAQVGAAD